MSVIPRKSGRLGPLSRGAAVTLHDTNTMEPTSAVFVGGAGNLKVTMSNGGDVTFSGLAAGTLLNISIKRAFATGSTATLVLALY